MGDLAPLTLCAFMACTGTTQPININTQYQYADHGMHHALTP